MKQKKQKKQKDVDVRALTVTVAVLAKLFDLSTERVRQLIELGVFQREADNGINLSLAIINYERVLMHGTRFFRADF